jgi:hypothetical protein
MSEEGIVARTSRDLAVAMLAGDERQLALLLSDQLSYGHQGGAVRGKAAFIDMILAKKPYRSIAITEDTTSIAGKNAIVRHVFAAEFEDDGKKGAARIGALEVWAKNGENWKLLARQGFRI